MVRSPVKAQTFLDRNRHLFEPLLQFIHILYLIVLLLHNDLISVVISHTVILTVMEFSLNGMEI